jgi:NADH-quinone oxidoreductase subunit G
LSTVSVTIDGKRVDVPAGTNIVEAASQNGVEVPHYCYHPRLTVAGNCRMCLVSIGMPKKGPDGAVVKNAAGEPEIAFMPKLQIGCATPVAEGMHIKTRSPEVTEARKGVMEFLLLNHPLDCPICDQAGECKLQEFSVDYGRGESRFVELKLHKPKEVPLGPKIVLDNERCILCSRCERFMREVAHQDCLGFVKRGSKTELSCYPGQEPNTNYDLNIVDICPVGALTSRDFRFRMRPWFLKETSSVCPGCETGCNTTVWSRDREVFRLTPRENEAVNKSWMCDTGRLDYRYINDPSRLTSPRLRDASGQKDATWEAALAKTVELSSDRAAGSVAVIGSARATTEELYLLAELGRRLGAELIDVVPRVDVADGYLMSANRNPNERGARLAGACGEHPGSRLGDIAKAISAGTVKVLIVFGEDAVAAGIPRDALERLDALIAVGILPNPTTELADVVLPGVSYAEKSGTFVNAKGRLQRIEAAITPPGEARPEWEILAAVLQRMGADAPRSLAELFSRVATTRLGIANTGFFGVPRTGLELSPPLAGKGAKLGISGNGVSAGSVPPAATNDKGQPRVD